MEVTEPGRPTIRYSYDANGNLVNKTSLNFIFVSATNHTLAVTKEGSVVSWGNNNYGQLGDGSTINKLGPVRILELSLRKIIAVTTGSSHSIAISEDGKLWSWGYNGNGQIGDGSTTNKTSPVQISGLSNISAVAAGSSNSIALKRDGTVWTWGNNVHGQLGDGTTVNKMSPTQITGLNNIAAIAAGSSHSVAVKRDGTVWTWGNNEYGQLGDGTKINRLRPVQLPGLSNVTAVSAGDGYSVAIKQDGTVWTWGNNEYGQLGDGTMLNRMSPAMITGLSNVTAVTAGSSHSIALDKNQKVWTWGNNSDGQLGDGTTINKTSPVQIIVRSSNGSPHSTLVRFFAVSAGNNHSIAITSDGLVLTWGNNNYGQLGGDHINSTIPDYISSSFENIVALAGGGSASLALKQDGSMWFWGDGYSNLPHPVFALDSVTAIDVGGRDTIISKQDGTVWSGGGDNFNQVPGLTNVVAVSAGHGHYITLKQDGTVRAWGENSHGQVGNGSTRPTQELSAPLVFSRSTVIVAISAGHNHSLAIDQNRNVWTWGDNRYGQLGNGTSGSDKNKLSPVKLPLGDVVAVSAGVSHSIALTAQGTVYTWGRNDYGQLGYINPPNSTTKRGIPVRLDLNDVVAVAAGDNFNIALKRDGTVWTWGANGSGQLGVYQMGQIFPTNISTPSPVFLDKNRTKRLDNIVSVAAGGAHSLVVKRDGTAMSWGRNFEGQLGIGNYDVQNGKVYPTPILDSSKYNLFSY